MNLLAFFLVSFIAILHNVSGQSLKTTQISYEPVDGSSKLASLASISYDSVTLDVQLLTWTPPSISKKKEGSSRLLRLQAAGTDSNTLTTLSAFNQTLQQILALHLDSHGNVNSASLSTRTPTSLSKISPTSKKSKSDRAKKDKTTTHEDSRNPQVVLIPATAGPLPKLNQRKPIKVDDGGREIPQQEEQPKSFIQKYWWIFLLVTVLALSGGGDK